MISNLFKRNLSVRKASLVDGKFVGKMVGQINHIVFGSDAIPSNFDDAFHKMLKEPNQYAIFVAEDKDKNNKIVQCGVAITTTQVLFMTCKPYLYIQDLVVDESIRGKGVGSALIQHIIQYCKSNNISYFDLVQPEDSDKFHEKRTKFYSGNGFEIGGRHRYLIL